MLSVPRSRNAFAWEAMSAGDLFWPSLYTPSMRPIGISKPWMSRRYSSNSALARRGSDQGSYGASRLSWSSIRSSSWRMVRTSSSSRGRPVT